MDDVSSWTNFVGKVVGVEKIVSVLTEFGCSQHHPFASSLVENDWHATSYSCPHEWNVRNEKGEKAQNWQIVSNCFSPKAFHSFFRLLLLSNLQFWQLLTVFYTLTSELFEMSYQLKTLDVDWFSGHWMRFKLIRQKCSICENVPWRPLHTLLTKMNLKSKA